MEPGIPKSTQKFEEIVRGFGTKSAEDVFSLQFRALKIVSMWPSFNGNRNNELTSKMILYVNTIVLSFCTIGLLLKAILTNDLVDRSEAMDIFTLTGSALYKMLFFYAHHEEMVDMVNWGATLADQVPPKWMQYVNFSTYVHCLMGFICITFWGLCPVFKFIFGETTLGNMKLPINVYEPVEFQGFVFVFFYAICYYGLLSSVQVYMAADCYLFTAIHLANGSLETVNKKLTNMESIVSKGAATHDVMNDYIKDCVKLHTRILVYIRKIDALFSSMFLADVLHAIISLSFAMLQASESKGVFENLKMFVFVSYCFVHQYLNSHFGQNLIDQQDTLNKELMISVPWNHGSPQMKKSYHIMTTGCLKSVRLSAWSVYTLQYATFLEFVKTMISYFMVLRQVQDETVQQSLET